jgi:hypothetical protein
MVRAVLRNKPCIAVLEPDTGDQHGGHTEAECLEIMLNKDYLERHNTEMTKHVVDWRWEWGKPNLTMPSGQEVLDVLFESAPIVWYRLSDPQDVSMRLIAERLIPSFTHFYGAPYVQLAYVQDELEQKFDSGKLELAPFIEGRRFHVRCA